MSREKICPIMSWASNRDADGGANVVPNIALCQEDKCMAWDVMEYKYKSQYIKEEIYGCKLIGNGNYKKGH